MNSAESIISDIKKGEIRPIYFLQGEETYFIDLVSNYIEATVLTDAEKSFNQVTFYGKDSDVHAIVDTAQRYPMMAERQVVLLKEAQALKGFDQLLTYIESPPPTTVLVISYKYKFLDKRTKVAKALAKHAVCLDAKKLYENQIPDWIAKFLSQRQYQIDPKAATLLVEFLGTDLSKISNELNKLSLIFKEGHKITAEDIEKNIGISKDYNMFELNNAITHKNVLKANRIVNYFIDNPKAGPLPAVIGMLYNYFTKVYLLHHNNTMDDRQLAVALKVSPFFVKDYKKAARSYPVSKTERIFALLQDYDLKSKGVNPSVTTDNNLLKELIFKILH